MRAKFLYEKFEEGTDPIEDLGIGNVPEVILPKLVKELAKYGIWSRYIESEDWGEGTWEIFLNDEVLGDLQIYYATDKAAKEHGVQGGFEISDVNGQAIMKNYTHNIDLVVKGLIRHKYSSKYKVYQRIKELQKELTILKRVEKILY